MPSRHHSPLTKISAPDGKPPPCIWQLSGSRSPLSGPIKTNICSERTRSIGPYQDLGEFVADSHEVAAHCPHFVQEDPQIVAFWRHADGVSGGDRKINPAGIPLNGQCREPVAVDPIHILIIVFVDCRIAFASIRRLVINIASQRPQCRITNVSNTNFAPCLASSRPL